MMKGHGQMGMDTEKLALRVMEKLQPLDAEKVKADSRAKVDLAPVK